MNKRNAAMSASALAFWLAVRAAGAADLSSAVEVNIAPQPLASAILQLSAQTRVQIMTAGADVRELSTVGFSGRMTLAEALQKLLLGSGLSFKLIGEDTVGLVRAEGSRSPATAPSTSGSDTRQPAETLHLAQAERAPYSDEPQNARSSDTLEEIVVSAQKRLERIQDVPVPVTALSAENLLAGNQLRIRDYFTSVPGLNVTPDDLSGTSRVTIRGLSTGGFSNPTVGIVVDDVPYGSSTGLGFGYVAPDIDPSELTRVEILRGPQGTLYGASTLGGLIKYVTVDPSTDAVSGRVQVGGSGVQHGDEAGYNLSGAINVPLGDTLAIRGSAFTRRDPGYIDDPVLRIDGINRTDVSGGRLSALWRPSDTLSLKLSALVQDARSAGSSLVQIGLGDLQQSTARGSGGYDVKVQAYNATVKAKLGSAELTAVSGYNINTSSFRFDLTPFFDPMQQTTGYPSVEALEVRKFTQEIRLSGPLGSHFEWLVGGFYTHEETPQTQSILVTDYRTGTVSDTAELIDFPSTFREYAVFADLTWHLTDSFDVQVGGRESRNEQSYRQTVSGPLVGPTPITQPQLDSADSSFTYMVTPRLRISPDLMVYARLASGYRPGGPNTSVSVGVPATYAPDKTQNFEIGIKGEMLQHRVSFDASLYYIDWKQIQLQLFDPDSGLGYSANGSRARSQGIELSFESRPLQGLTVAAWIAWNDAKLADPLPAAGPGTPLGAEGDRLPGSSRFSGSVSVEQQFPLTTLTNAFVAGSLSYASDREGVFASSPERQAYPSYALANVRAGLKHGPWTTSLFINNLADRRAALSGGLGTTYPDYFQYTQPRTGGVFVSRSF
jgi:iron complex outermembrane recepter protein